MAALGAITLAFGLYRLWVERGGRIVAASTSPGWVGTIFGALTGLTSQIAHAGGPPFQMWVTPRRLPHLVFIGTSSVLFALINWMKVPAYLALDAFPHEVVVATEPGRDTAPAIRLLERARQARQAAERLRSRRGPPTPHHARHRATAGGAAHMP